MDFWRRIHKPPSPGTEPDEKNLLLDFREVIPYIDFVLYMLIILDSLKGGEMGDGVSYKPSAPREEVLVSLIRLTRRFDLL